MAVHDLLMDGATLSTVQGNLNLNLSPNGNGKVVLGSAAVVDNLRLDGSTVVSTSTDATHTDIRLIPATGGRVVMMNMAVVDDLQLDGNTLSSINGMNIQLNPLGQGNEVMLGANAIINNLELKEDTIVSRPSSSQTSSAESKNIVMR